MDDTRIVSFVTIVKDGSDPAVRIYDLSECSATGVTKPTHELVLPLRRDLRLTSVSLDTGRACGSPAAHSEALAKAQYFSNDDWCLLYYEPLYVFLGKDVYNLSMRLCMSDLQQLAKDTSVPGTTTVVPWSSWGRAARLTLRPGSRQSFGVSAVSGSQIHEDNPVYPFFYDYHPIRVGRARLQPTSLSVSVQRGAVSDVPILRQDEVSDALAAPRADFDYVQYHHNVFPLQDLPQDHSNVHALLSGDVFLFCVDQVCHGCA